MESRKKIIVIMPALNAEKTLKKTYDDLPKELLDEIILVDDCSKDDTVKIAKEIGLDVYVHERNLGYGANQKTCYKEALKRNADITVMIHPDYQYDPKKIPELIKPLIREECDAVFGSRILGGKTLEGGMPKWKYIGNILLTAIENIGFNIHLTEYHSGFRAYSRKYLENINFAMNSDSHVFDTEIIVQGVIHKMRIKEIPIETRYFEGISTIGFFSSILYALKIFITIIKYKLHCSGIVKFRQFY